MPRAYLRLDPGYDEHKESYPDGPYAALIATFCHGEMQPERGRFRNERFLRAILGKRGKHVPYLIAHGDLVHLPDGRLYIDGWDEWQEGDWKVTERVTRIRSRKRSDVTPAVTVGVTPRVTALRKSVSGSGAELSGALATHAPDDPIHDAHQWLGKHRCHLTPGGNADIQLARMVDIHGIEKVIEAWESMPPQTDGAQYVYGARNILSPLPGAKVVGGQEQREAEASDRHAKQLARTQRLLAEQRGERRTDA